MTVTVKQQAQKHADAVREMLKKYAQENGLTVSLSGLTFDSTVGILNIRSTFTLPVGGASAKPKEAIDFEMLADAYGLQASDLGRSFTYGRAGEFKIVGLHPRKAKPILCEKDGKRFMFTVQQVVGALGNFDGTLAKRLGATEGVHGTSHRQAPPLGSTPEDEIEKAKRGQ